MTSNSVHGRIDIEALLSCESAKELVNSKEFYTLLELYCHDIGQANPQFEEFLNVYFNDEGYVDIWRIPQLMIDASSENRRLHTLFDSEEFRDTFRHFLTGLYNFCLGACQSSLYMKTDSSSSHITLLSLKTRQRFLGTLMAAFINVMENIENCDRVEKIA